MINQFRMFLALLKDSFRDLMPIVLVILFFQAVILQSVPEHWESTAIGLVIVGFGLALFLQGLEVGIFPIGEKLSSDFAKKGSHFWVLLFGFMIGFGTTIAEPALLVIAQKAATISSGRIDAEMLRYVVAGSVGFAIWLGVYRIILGHPIHYYIITGYVMVVAVTFITPHEIVGLAYDLGGVTTSTVTVPLVAALGIGLASNIKGRDPVIDGFGLIAFASLTPMIFVQIYGIYVYEFVEASSVVAQIAIIPETTIPTQVSISSIISGLYGVLGDVAPVLAIILFFQYAILKKPLPTHQLKSIGGGFILVIIGLYAFILGLEMGLFSLGETMAYELTQLGNHNLIYLFGFAIGFSTTMAEPALMAIAKKSKEISNGKIDDFYLRLFVAVGVAIGISLGSYRIVHGDFIQNYIIVGYAIVILLTYIAPKYIIPIAYDSGGVTTSTVTVPLVAALGIGLATNIPGRSPLMDGFGLIAFASLFPMITVMAYGIIGEKFNFKTDEEIEAEHHAKLGGENDGFELASVNIDGQTISQALNLSFEAVIVIVPENKKDDALHAAKEAGASGVTIMQGSGMGLAEMTNLYRTSVENSDSILLFILPSILVEPVIKNITLKLHITTTGDGIVFSTPITHMKGISLRQQHVFKEGLEQVEQKVTDEKVHNQEILHNA